MVGESDKVAPFPQPEIETPNYVVLRNFSACFFVGNFNEIQFAAFMDPRRFDSSSGESRTANYRVGLNSVFTRRRNY